MLNIFWINLIDLTSSYNTLKNTSLWYFNTLVTCDLSSIGIINIFRIWLVPFCRIRPRVRQGLGALWLPFTFDYLGLGTKQKWLKWSAHFLKKCNKFKNYYYWQYNNQEIKKSYKLKYNILYHSLDHLFT